MDESVQRDFSEICRRFGWKCTAQRLAVYDSIRGNRTHPDVDMVWSAVKTQLPTVTRESVYRILNEFTERGLIVRLDHVPCARYDAETSPHGHFICERCGSITDFALSDPSAPHTTAGAPGRVRHWELRCVGICPACDVATDGALCPSS